MSGTLAPALPNSSNTCSPASRTISGSALPMRFRSVPRYFGGAGDVDVARSRNQVVAPILLPGRLVVPRGARTLIAVADGGDEGRVHPEVLEIFLRRVRAPLAERDVVFGRAALVAVPFDPDGNVRPLACLVEGGLERGPGSLRELGAVVLEVHADGRDLRSRRRRDRFRRRRNDLQRRLDDDSRRSSHGSG